MYGGDIVKRYRYTEEITNNVQGTLTFILTDWHIIMSAEFLEIQCIRPLQGSLPGEVPEQAALHEEGAQLRRVHPVRHR